MISGIEYSGFDLMQWPALLGVLLAGFALGMIFFSSLWWTTGKILHGQHPVAWVVGGFVLRMALVLPALYWLTDMHWERLLVCVAGFFGARLLVVKLSAKWQPSGLQKSVSTAVVTQELMQENSHAPES